jgi:N-acetylglucosaminyldiphosphoundecaprenol N-acetyl-beta-D-mannosaminyltransferase
MENMSNKTTRILGLDFFAGTAQDAVRCTHKGGLVVAPSGPGLATMEKDLPYQSALENADLILADSGYLTLLTRLFVGKRLNRISGLEFLQALLSDDHFRNSKTLWVDTSKEEGKANRKYLNRAGIEATAADSYIAPFYTLEHIEDKALLKRIHEARPDYVIINIAGNKQEPLGYYLKQNMNYTPAIICTGAAIAFMTGAQAGIPTWADRMFLGWLCRCLENPSVYVPRYARAIKLAWLVLRFGDQLPRRAEDEHKETH